MYLFIHSEHHTFINAPTQHERDSISKSVTGQEGHTKTEEQKLEILVVNVVMKVKGRCN